jgi:hypothetical protein
VRIDFERRGGFTAVPLRTSVDTAALPPDEAHQFEQLVEDANVFSLASQTPQAGGADQFQYNLTVSQGATQHAISLGESQVPESLRPLLVRLTALARRTT